MMLSQTHSRHRWWGGLYIEMIACVRWGKAVCRDDRWKKALCRDDGMCEVGKGSMQR